MAKSYTFKLSLKKADPSISRVVKVPGDYSMYELHLVFQVCLLWNDREPFELVLKDLTVGVEPSYSGAGLQHGAHRYRHADELTVSDVFTKADTEATYTYDFSRLWEFNILCLAIEAEVLALPVCLESYEAAPLEDADDLETFYGMMIAYADPSIQLHDLAKELLGEDFDPLGPQADTLSSYLEVLFGEEIEPHGTEPEEEDYSWWDPSKYDDNMRITVKKEEIERAIPEDLKNQKLGEKQDMLLRILRGERTE